MNITVNVDEISLSTAYDKPCYHDHDEECYGDDGYIRCRHQHCFACGGCGCPGYCDDYQTYNLRPAETGGTDPEGYRPGAPVGDEENLRAFRSGRWVLKAAESGDAGNGEVPGGQA